MSQSGQADGTKTGVGSLASDTTKEEWKRVYDFYTTVRGARADRIGAVAEKFGFSRKGAKRRIKNYEGWQLRVTGNLPPDPFRAETLALGSAMLQQKRAEQQNRRREAGRSSSKRAFQPGGSRPSNRHEQPTRGKRWS